MAILDGDLALFKDKVLSAKRPMIFYDDDADGLCSYLLCLHAREGETIGIRAHSSATITPEYLRKVAENQPDLIVVLDKPYIDPHFIETVTAPILWLDHHAPQKPEGRVTYLNPRILDDADNRCTSYWTWKALGRPEDLWIAAIGNIRDWQLNDVAEEFWKKYPDILQPVQSAPEALYQEPFGALWRIIEWNLKGDNNDVRTSVKILSRIESPYELLEHKTPRAKLLHKRYQPVQKEYDRMVSEARQSANESKLLYHYYPRAEISMLSQLSNQLIYEFPDKIIFLVREHGGDHKFSIRGDHIDIASAVKKAMETGIHGNAGGHTSACGGNVRSEDFPKFLEAFKQALGL